MTEQNLYLLTKLIGIFQKKGNKQKTFSIIENLLADLKKKKKKIKFQATPLGIINHALINIKPSFLIHPIIRAGIRYNIAIPVTESRALFMALQWVRKSVIKNNKTPTRLAVRISDEIRLLLQRKGFSSDLFNNYVKLALDHKPFNRFLRRKRKQKNKNISQFKHFKKSNILTKFKKRSIHLQTSKLKNSFLKKITKKCN